MLTPTDAVLSVNGQTGAVTLDAADVGVAVTSTSVSDGTNTFNKYTHPTYTTQPAGLYKIGRDSTGHVVIGDAFTIPTVNNATLTIQKNGTNVQTFTANASSNVTANITVPVKLSDLTERTVDKLEEPVNAYNNPTLTYSPFIYDTAGNRLYGILPSRVVVEESIDAGQT